MRCRSPIWYSIPNRPCVDVQGKVRFIDKPAVVFEFCKKHSKKSQDQLTHPQSPIHTMGTSSQDLFLEKLLRSGSWGAFCLDRGEASCPGSTTGVRRLPQAVPAAGAYCVTADWICIAHTRETRDEELRRAAYGAGAGWLASRLAHRECKREREVASGVQRTRSGGTLRVNRRNRRKQPRPAHTVSGHSPCQQEKTAAGSREVEKPSEHGPGVQKLLAGGAASASRRVRPGLLPVFHQRRHGADYGVVTK
ncbi:hypothetical protein NDU88_005089 [Pleurodeles waltl]|uniref:Uncharacterized protein n=1 Tax=Pleurodeles waltl TaxID=8319 RepID=A0AAV7WAW6_PLEWA|nr:hypothetical protein NDU88_005089 [Pleurodeles waltl]